MLRKGQPKGWPFLMRRPLNSGPTEKEACTNMLNRWLAVALILILGACGGGSSGPTGPSSVPTPVNYSGLYTGTVMSNFEGNLTRYDAQINIQHTGSTIQADYLILSNAFGVSSRYPIGTGTLVDGVVNIYGSYTSRGCGTATYSVIGRFSGDGKLLNITYLIQFSTCSNADIRGELKR